MEVSCSVVSLVETMILNGGNSMIYSVESHRRPSPYIWIRQIFVTAENPPKKSG